MSPQIPLATFSVLHALGRMSPKAALARSDRAQSLPGAPTAAWTKAIGLEVSSEHLEWSAGETACAVDAVLTRNRGATTSYCFLATRFAHPSTILPTLIAAGVPLLYALTKSGLWARCEPMDAFVVVVLELGGDFAQYVLGERLEALGDEQLTSALGAFRCAARDGWPGWAEAGMQVVDLPQKEVGFET